MITWILFFPHLWIPIVIFYTLLVMSGYCEKIDSESLFPTEVDPWRDINNMRQCLGV